MSNIITGIINGLITYNRDGSPRLLPFQDAIEEATFRYASESLMVETFGADGMKGASAACPYRHECSMEFMTKNLAFSFLQAAMATLARDAEVNEQVTYNYVLQASDITGDVASLDVTWTPVVGTDVTVGDKDGKPYPVTFTSGSPNTLEFGSADFPAVVGTKISVSYFTAPTGTNNEIAIGSGNQLSTVGVYGVFRGCPESYKITIPKGNLNASLEMSVGSDAASANTVITALRDERTDSFAILKRM